MNSKKVNFPEEKFSCFPHGIRKRGVGAIMGMFVATIIIVLILIGFVLLSTVVKVAGGNKGVGVVDEDKVGLEDVDSYRDNFEKLLDMRYSLTQQNNLPNAIEEGENG